MKLKMKVEVSGNRGDGTEWPSRGGEIEVPDAEGADLVASDMAVEVKAEKKAEKKVEPEPEPVVETATGDDSNTETTALTTGSGPTKRGPGRPRKNT